MNEFIRELSYHGCYLYFKKKLGEYTQHHDVYLKLFVFLPRKHASAYQMLSDEHFTISFDL